MAQSIYQKIVFKLLNSMKLGRLHLSFGNSAYEFGEGDEIAASIQVNDKEFFKQIVLHGDIGFGESFMEKRWETPDLTSVISWMIMNIENLPGMSGSAKRFNPISLLRYSDQLLQYFQPNSMRGSKRNIAKHYDLSNEFFNHFLDPSMTYSSALFLNEDDSLEKAQQQKYDSLCQSIKLTKNDHLLEIGCGWGGFAVYAAKKYGCKITGITISKAQYQYAIERVKMEKLDKQVKIVFKDYRLITGKYDKVVSIEMIEAVGHKYFSKYFERINDLLKPTGILGLQAIIIPDKRYEEYRKSADWIRKHIFPGGLLPSIRKINESINQASDLNLYSLKEMGLSYAKTLRCWYDSFNSDLTAIRKLGFDESFLRKWAYYLCSCEASFELRNINVVQMVYARPNNPGF